MNLETIEGLLQAFDDAIDKREKDLLMIDRQYVDNNGNVISSQYDEYRKRKQAVIERFRINNCCKKRFEATLISDSKLPITKGR